MLTDKLLIKCALLAVSLSVYTTKKKLTAACNANFLTSSAKPLNHHHRDPLITAALKQGKCYTG